MSAASSVPDTHLRKGLPAAIIVTLLCDPAPGRGSERLLMGQRADRLRSIPASADRFHAQWHTPSA